MDLIRELMIRFEGNDISVPAGRTAEEVAYHVKQLIDGGFLEGEIVEGPAPGNPGDRIPLDYFVHDITWKGHDFV
jgi:hypothetical protein